MKIVNNQSCVVYANAIYTLLLKAQNIAEWGNENIFRHDPMSGKREMKRGKKMADCWVGHNVYQFIMRGNKVWGEGERREMKGGIKGRWTGTHSASTWATGHLYCAVLNRQISAYCRTVGREQGHTEGLAKLESVRAHTRAKVIEVHKQILQSMHIYTHTMHLLSISLSANSTWMPADFH